MILNKFPYTNGHLMVAPMSTSPAPGARRRDDGGDHVPRAARMTALETSYAPHGYNVGFNQGRVAGAGVEHHIHMHVVPRWGGDTNFMPVLGDTRVMNQTLEDSYETAAGRPSADLAISRPAGRDLQGLRHPRHLRRGARRRDRPPDRSRFRPGARPAPGQGASSCASGSAMTCA